MRCPEPKVLLLDVDGCLTDGFIHVNHNGFRSKVFHCRDARAIRAFVEQGWEVHIVSASHWPGIQGHVNTWPVQLHIGNPKTHDDVMKITGGRPYIACGDDYFDLEMLDGATRAFCPRNADPAVRGMSKVKVLSVCGGMGVVAELQRLLLMPERVQPCLS